MAPEFGNELPRVMPSSQIIFLSHSAEDKPLARRLRRRLRAFGAEVWIDEDNLRKGSRLAPAIQQQIQSCDVMLIAATNAAANSQWVRREIQMAKQAHPPKIILPFFVDVEAKRAAEFKQHLGIDATDIHAFEEALQEVLKSIGQPSAERSLEVQAKVRSDLALARKEEPLLEHLFREIQRGRGLAFHHRETVAGIGFHTLEYALTVAYELATEEGRTAVASIAGTLFSLNRTGHHVLRQHLAGPTPMGHLLESAVGRRLHKEDLNGAIALFEQCTHMSWLALRQFVEANAEMLDSDQVRQIVSLTTRRVDQPDGFTLEAIFSILRSLAEVNDVAALCKSWIQEGVFDVLHGHTFMSSRGLTLQLRRGTRDPQHADDLAEELVARVRTLARSKSLEHVTAAVEYVMYAAEFATPWKRLIVSACDDATGVAEWDDWPDRDQASCLINCHLEAERRGKDRGWAWKRYVAAWKAVCWARDARRASIRGAIE